MNGHSRCPRCGRVEGTPLEDGSHWCSWCGQAFGLESEQDIVTANHAEAEAAADWAVGRVAYYRAHPEELTADDLVAVLDSCPAERRVLAIGELSSVAKPGVLSQGLGGYLEDPDAASFRDGSTKLQIFISNWL